MTNREVKQIIKSARVDRLTKRVISEIVSDSKDHSGANMQERMISRLNDISHGGQSGTIYSLIYYTHTNNFFRTYQKEIVALVEETAAELGEHPLSMVANFNGLEKQFTETEVAKVLFGNWQETDFHKTISNHLAWFAYKQIAYNLQNQIEE